MFSLTPDTATATTQRPTSPTTHDQWPCRLSTYQRLPARRRPPRGLCVFIRPARLPGMEAMQDPKPAEIRRECLRIQEGWTEREMLRRAPWWAEQQAVEFPRWAPADWLEAVDATKA